MDCLFLRRFETDGGFGCINQQVNNHKIPVKERKGNKNSRIL